MKQVVEKDRNPGKYYKELKTSLLTPGFDKSINFAQGDMTWSEFKNQSKADINSHVDPTTEDGHERVILYNKAILVRGAGSPEVNGCYLPQGKHAGAFEFTLYNATTKQTFEMFKVKSDSTWWNIQESVNGTYPKPVYYGTDEVASSVLPGTRGWGSTEYREYWQGMDPAPCVELVERKSCLVDLFVDSL